MGVRFLMSEVPLYGTCETVKARFWPWLLGKSPSFFEMFPFRSAADTRLDKLHTRLYCESLRAFSFPAFLSTDLVCLGRCSFWIALVSVSNPAGLGSGVEAAPTPRTTTGA